MSECNYTLPMPFRKAVPWTVAISLLFLCSYMTRSTLAPLLVYVEKSLQIGHVQSTSLLLMQSIGYSISLFCCGFLLSRVTPAHMAAFSVFFSSTCLCLMPCIETLNEARLIFTLLGFGCGFYFPAGIAILSTLVYPSDWGKAVSIHEVAANLNFILIPLLAQLFLQFTTWQGVCAYLGYPMLVISILFVFFGRGGQEHVPLPSHSGYKELLFTPASWAVVILLIIAQAGEYSVFSILQLYLTDEVGFTPGSSNILISSSRMVTPFVVILGGWASDRFNVYLIIKSCLVLHALALTAMAFDIPLLSIIGITFQTVAISCLFPSIFKAFAIRFPLSQQALLMSLSMTSSGLISNGGVTIFLGFCGEHFTFGIGFICLALYSIGCIWVTNLLKVKVKQVIIPI